MGWEWEWEEQVGGKKQGCTCGWQSHIRLRHSVTQWIYLWKYEKNNILNWKNHAHPMAIIPMHTRNTAGTGNSMPWVAKVHTRTCTCTTHFGKTAGFPIPVSNPMCTHSRSYLLALIPACTGTCSPSYPLVLISARAHTRSRSYLLVVVVVVVVTWHDHCSTLLLLVVPGGASVHNSYSCLHSLPSQCPTYL